MAMNRMSYERPNQRSSRRSTQPDKPKGLKTGTFIAILLVIGVILYFISA